jgi:cobalamin synthase
MVPAVTDAPPPKPDAERIRRLLPLVAVVLGLTLLGAAWLLYWFATNAPRVQLR